MVKVDIFRDADGSIVKYIVSGHASLNSSVGGGDILCAAVSAVAQSAVIGLTEVAGIRPGLEVHEGYLECVVPDDINGVQREKAGVILKTMVLSMKDLEQQYGKHIAVKEMEV